MKKTRFSETKIVSILKKNEAGMKASELCREYGISEATFYNWKAINLNSNRHAPKMLYKSDISRVSKNVILIKQDTTDIFLLITFHHLQYFQKFILHGHAY
jgi:hypothetical protein